ncbi:MBL fold metallo-hydrolase [Bradyrhizobium brasilense]|uniref:ComEC/Rec2 family competence protein n=1 Tax=Bradyrhizobium brasilense TaxID=1419277 RepID=UPI0028773E0F|nr:MBL fold metallo-hydrolase [Bradyrhizobium brasilense]MCP3414238.1 MBL fold metallo-hydrolase [Bradyrhizobium brasilense]
MLRVEMIAARQGDCLWISYGPREAEHHLIVDGGPEKAKVLRAAVERRMEADPSRRLHIDLLVVTHIDDDHIGGVLDLLEHIPDGLTIGEIWFNAYRHLVPPDKLGEEQAERLSELLDGLVARGTLKWNTAFGGKAAVVAEGGELPRLCRQDGLVLTLLSPDQGQLIKLAGAWKEVLKGAEGAEAKEEPKDLLGRNDAWPPDIPTLARARFCEDRKEANGSSIAFLLEYGDIRVLFAADSFPGRILASLGRLTCSKPVKLNAYKLSHHGSKKNNSSDLLRSVSCSTYLISTDGSYSGHPDAEALARVLVSGGPNPLLIFNARTKFTTRWNGPRELKRSPPFRTRYPDDPMSISIRFDGSHAPTIE